MNADASIFQVNFNGNHWALGVIYPKQKKIALLDSLRDAQRALSFYLMVDSFLRWLCRALNRDTNGGTLKPWLFLVYPKAARRLFSVSRASQFMVTNCSPPLF